ncbi:MAG: HAMP domain-containing histidine kinase, partial [Deltaproteobacteria bacterium]
INSSFKENKKFIQKEGQNKLNHFSNEIIASINLIESFARKNSKEIEKCLKNNCEEEKIISLFDVLLDSSNSIDIIFLLDANKKLVNFVDILHEHELNDSFFSTIIKNASLTDKGSIGPPISIDELVHLPITYKFSNGNGYFGILLESNILFDLVLNFNSISDYKMSVQNYDTKKFYHLESVEKGSASRNIKLHGTEIVFATNYESLLEKNRNRHIFVWAGTFILCLISSIFIFQFLINNERVRKNYLNALSERNLLHTVLHDISNPLTYLNFGLKKISKDVQDEETMAKLNMSLNLIGEVFDSVRGLSQLTSKENSFDKKELDLKNLIEETISIQKEIFNCQNFQFDFRFEDNHLFSTRIPENVLKNEIIGNLIGNAIKFSKNDKSIEIVFKDKKLHISNYSEKIPEGVINDINKISPTSSRLGNRGQKGSGMGIYIVKIITTYFDVGFQFKQDPVSNKVTSTLIF